MLQFESQSVQNYNTFSFIRRQYQLFIHAAKAQLKQPIMIKILNNRVS